jgi:hypothetical protein
MTERFPRRNNYYSYFYDKTIKYIFGVPFLEEILK